MPVISAIRRRIKILSQKKKEFRKAVNDENVLYLIQNLNIQSMPRQKTSVHLQDGREIGNRTEFAGQISL